MRTELKPFQQLATDDLVTHLRAARREADTFPQAVLLSAPTGAGKTLIATAVIEALLEGDSDELGTADTTVLWLTDLPQLNEQTRRKMLAHSSVLGDHNLVTIETTFEEQALAPGTVYFLNTQKLGRNSGLTSPRDRRNWTLWDVIRNTIDARPRDFVLVIDEAHRGMIETPRDRDEAATIVQRFIKGGDGLPPTPIILGISATPDRFLTMMAGRRNLRPQVDIPADEVRESGLLKQTLLVYHPHRREPSDFTLLLSAAERLTEYAEAWSSYSARAASDASVRPILVVQVANAPTGRRSAVTETDLAMALSVIESVVGTLDERAIAHAFQEETAIPVGDGRMLRYVAPADIDDDPHLQVVFFKTALTTGWDCPRAEVMMSFRRAVDDTAIAQLVGRMVRTPLARTIEGDEFLNTVSLYLPHYDRAGLDKVLRRLQRDDPEFLPPISIRSGADRVRLGRNTALDDCFTVLADLPTYDIARVRKTTHVRRLVKLARLLDRDAIAPGALAEAMGDLVTELQAARRRLEGITWWTQLVKDAGTIDLRTVEWTFGVGTVGESQTLVPITQQNVDDLFAAAGRRIGEGIHKAYWRARADEDATPRVVRRIAKLEMYALLQHAETARGLEDFAEARVADLLAEHGAEISSLPADRNDGYRQVRLTATDPEPRPLGSFDFIEGTTRGDAFERHLYVDDAGRFFYKFSKSSWEQRVLDAAMSAPDFVGWLRIEDRKNWALAIPYELDGETRPFYPDFLVFRREKKRLVADILDPHDPGRSDWLPKVRGLAKYADRHWQHFGRIEPVFIERGTVYRLDLRVEKNRRVALAAGSVSDLKAKFVPDT